MTKNKNTSVSLGDYFDNLIKRKISTGRYKNASEVIRAGLRLLDDEENQIVVLQKSIQEGINSGIASDFNSEAHLKTLKANKNLNGQIPNSKNTFCYRGKRTGVQKN